MGLRTSIQFGSLRKCNIRIGKSLLPEDSPRYDLSQPERQELKTLTEPDFVVLFMFFSFYFIKDVCMYSLIGPFNSMTFDFQLILLALGLDLIHFWAKCVFANVFTGTFLSVFVKS